MAITKPVRVKTISEFHRLRDLPEPNQPLISIIDFSKMNLSSEDNNSSWALDFYSVSIKKGISGKFNYGQQIYDFDKGVMFFISPSQVYRVQVEENTINPSGWILLIHPDFLWNTSLARKIRQYDYFDYSANEALFLSEKEEETLNSIIQNIQSELQSHVDKFSKKIIVSHIEVLLNYAERFYNRQFITREKANHQILERLEKLLTDYFNRDDLISKGLPTVQYVAQNLNISPGYLNGLLKVLTGQTTQQHIHEKLIEKAKERLSVTDLSVTEIAYGMGFEHLQSFSKFFKTKTNLSPMEFRHSFN